MDDDSEVPRVLAEIRPSPWNGNVYRHMFADYRPDRENTLGARWNPPGVPAIYTSLSRDTVLAEVEHQLNLEPLRPSVRRTLYKIEIALSSVLDLSSWTILEALSLSPEGLASIDHAACRKIGGAVEGLGQRWSPCSVGPLHGRHEFGDLPEQADSRIPLQHRRHRNHFDPK